MDEEHPSSPVRALITTTHTSDKHSQAVLAELNILRCEKELCDVILNVGSRKIAAHRNVLSACSPYFRAMFTGKMAESRQTEITIHDVDETVFELLINFCYTSHIVVNEENVFTLLPAACLLQLTEIQNICCEFLKRQLNTSNWVAIKIIADTYFCRELVHSLTVYMLHNFQEVMESEKFLLLPVEEIVEIVSSDELNVQAEKEVFNAVMKWINHNVAERRQHLSQLLQYVRLPLLDVKFLVRTVGSDLLVRSDHACRDLVDEAKNCWLLPKEQPHTNNRRTKRHMLFVIEGENENVTAGVQRLDLDIPNCEVMKPLNEKSFEMSVTVLNGLIYAIGVHGRYLSCRNIRLYNPLLNEWSCNVAGLSPVRSNMGVAALDGLLYAIGGFEKTVFSDMHVTLEYRDTVNRYDPKKNEWSSMPSMITKRAGLGATALTSCLYAIGGFDGNSVLSVVERYDPSLRRWAHLSPMLTRRYRAGCAVLNNLIYVAGGQDDNKNSLCSAERYYPKTNTWSSIACMSSPRSGLQLAVVNGKLYAVGGMCNGVILKTIEVYNVAQNTWEFCCNLNYGVVNVGVGVV